MRPVLPALGRAFRLWAPGPHRRDCRELRRRTGLLLGRSAARYCGSWTRRPTVPRPAGIRPRYCRQSSRTLAAVWPRAWSGASRSPVAQPSVPGPVLPAFPGPDSTGRPADTAPAEAFATPGGPPGRGADAGCDTRAAEARVAAG